MSPIAKQKKTKTKPKDGWEPLNSSRRQSDNGLEKEKEGRLFIVA